MRLESVPRLMLIGGEMVASATGDWLTSINPANEAVIGRVPAGDGADIAQAVDAAQRAQPGWSELDVFERGRRLRSLAAKLIERADQLLEIEVADTGNTVASLRADVRAAADNIEFFAGLGPEIKGETIPATTRHLHFTLREPYGVVGRITPFNHPILFAAARLAAPLMAGNTIVIKPTETSPLSSTILGEICREALPPGVVNIVTGLGPTAGDALVCHPAVKRLAFTGSVPTGMAIQRRAAEGAVKSVSLELGGKNPLLIFPDVDPDAAAQAAVAGMNFSWQGQSCGSTSRLLVHDSLYDSVVERVAERVAALKVGDPADPSSQMGPINSARQYGKVQHYIEVGKNDGAVLKVGGKRPPGAGFSRGYWIEPTLFTDVTMAMTIAREEIFGPILSVMRWDKLDDALAMANQVEYGLTASVWTHDVKAALTVARRLRAGYVWINGVATHFLGTPFGGVKNSGLGREESLDELLSYTETKTVNILL